MSIAENGPVKRWSTVDVPAPKRLDFFAAALSDAVVPCGVDGADSSDFHAEVSTARLGEVSVTKTSGSAHRAYRGRAELARSSSHSFNLLISLQASWTAEHGGRLSMMPRDALLFDSERHLETDVRETFSAVNVSLPEAWLRTWLPDPGVLMGRRIPGNSLWGLTLSSYISELSPELAAAPPLPLSVIADQIGSLLVLTARAIQEPQAKPRSAARLLHERIDDCIKQRCNEHQLTAADIALATAISVRTLHRTLAAHGESFGALLIDARFKAALRMLNSPLFKRVTSVEIGRRAGFSSSSHFARVVRLRTGYTPRQIRRTVEPDDE